jgi:hypothetical protein
LQAELERIGFQESTGVKLPPRIFVQKEDKPEEEKKEKKEPKP